MKGFLVPLLLVAAFPGVLSAVEPTAVADGLAMYRIGQGEPVLLMPYPHASGRVSMAESRLAAVLIGMGRSVITFDPPGAYRSTREPQIDTAEMLGCGIETLDFFGVAHGIDGVTRGIDIVGHSMSGFCALAFSIEHPSRVRTLVLIGSTSGWPAIKKWGIQKQLGQDRRAYRRLMWHGFWLFAGLGNLADHKKLDHIIDQASFVDTSYVEEIEISRDDNRRPPPVRAAWPGYLRRSNADYRDRLDELQLPVLLCVGRHDPQTPPVMSRELHDGINGSELVVFESSGHAPFVEQEAEFVCVLREFLSRP